MTTNTLTRPEHGKVIRTIRKVTGHTDRNLTFTEAHNWLASYKHDTMNGYDAQTAAQRAYDCVFSARRTR